MYPIGFNIFVDYNGDLHLCYQSERSNSVFYFQNIRDVLQIEGMRKVFKFLGMGAVFFFDKLTYQTFFEIVSRVDDKL